MAHLTYCKSSRNEVNFQRQAQKLPMLENTRLSSKHLFPSQCGLKLLFLQQRNILCRNSLNLNGVNYPRLFQRKPDFPLHRWILEEFLGFWIRRLLLGRLFLEVRWCQKLCKLRGDQDLLPIDLLLQMFLFRRGSLHCKSGSSFIKEIFRCMGLVLGFMVYGLFLKGKKSKLLVVEVRL